MCPYCFSHRNPSSLCSLLYTMQSPFASTIAFYTANCTYSPAPRTPAISRHLTIPHSPSVTPRKKPAHTADPAKKRMQVRFFGHLMPQNGSIKKRRGTPWHSKSGLFQSLTTNRARSAPTPRSRPRPGGPWCRSISRQGTGRWPTTTIGSICGRGTWCSWTASWRESRDASRRPATISGSDSPTTSG